METRQQAIEKLSNDILNQLGYKDVKDITKVSIKELHSAAENFIKTVKNNLYDNITESASSLEDDMKKLKALYETIAAKNAVTPIFQAQISFEKELNEFLGRKMFLTYVTDTGDLNVQDEAFLYNLVTKGSYNKGRLNISPDAFSAQANGSNLIHALDQNLDKATRRVFKRLRRSVKLRCNVYTTAIERYEGSLDNRFYWITVGEGAKYGRTDPIANKGPIAEGYANAVINEEVNIQNNWINDSLEYLWENYIKGKKDSIDAVIKGDVQVNNNGNIQFAIKEGQFSTAKLGQYLFVAENILKVFPNGNAEISPELLQIAMPRLTRTINTATEKILKSIENIEKEGMETFLRNVLHGVSYSKKEEWNRKVNLIQTLAVGQ